MYSLMSLQIVISIEALRTLIAAEGAVVMRLVLRIHLMHLRCVAAVVGVDHAMRHSANHLQVPTRIVDVR